MDHLSSLTSIIDTRKRNGKSTFSAFIDFRKAFDSINRDILWRKLARLGLSSKMIAAVKSLYSNIASRVRLNGHYTDWFAVKTGLRQGYALSTILFNLYINDLALLLKSSHKGINIDNEDICVLKYADDIVLIAEHEDNLQCMLTMLNDWCESNCMSVNGGKSNIVHFRPNACTRSEFLITCVSLTIEYSSQYMYLGVILSNTWILV